MIVWCAGVLAYNCDIILRAPPLDLEAQIDIGNSARNFRWVKISRNLSMTDTKTKPMPARSGNRTQREQICKQRHKILKRLKEFNDRYGIALDNNTNADVVLFTGPLNLCFYHPHQKQRPRSSGIVVNTRMAWVLYPSLRICSTTVASFHTIKMN